MGAEFHLVEHRIGSPKSCPECDAGPDDLVIATKPCGRRNGREVVRFVGYDCRCCSAKMRFDARNV